MILLIDNRDSFTYNILHYMQQCGAECRLLHSVSTDIGTIEALKPKGIVFSPGPCRPASHPLLFDLIKIYQDRIPLLGICLGHQAIGEFYGARLLKAPLPVHGKTCTIRHTGHKMYGGIPRETEVMRYHSLILEDIPDDSLEITARTTEGLPMSLAHKYLPVWGLQFHPESILSQYGLQMFKNWFALIR